MLLCSSAGKYITFIVDPLMHPNIIKHGWPPVRTYRSPRLHEDIQHAFKLLQADHLCALTESMMGNLMSSYVSNTWDWYGAGTCQWTGFAYCCVKSKIQWKQLQEALQTCRGQPHARRTVGWFRSVIGIKGVDQSDKSKPTSKRHLMFNQRTRRYRWQHTVLQLFCTYPLKNTTTAPDQSQHATSRKPL